MTLKDILISGQISPNNMIDDNHKIVAGFTGSPIGGTGDDGHDVRNPDELGRLLRGIVHERKTYKS